jgi:hypothetical protein
MFDNGSQTTLVTSRELSPGFLSQELEESLPVFPKAFMSFQYRINRESWFIGGEGL